MKVTTDACIQGAWTTVAAGVKRVLDIGAGTGLLSLMLAQRDSHILIDAIEFDKAAADQARDNVAASPWKERISVIESDVRSYVFSHKYDLIISNPPFFNNSLLSDKDAKNMARHTLSLSYSELLSVMEDNLATNGYVSVILPFTEYQGWRELALQNGWFESGKLSISHISNGQIKRVVGLFSRQKTAVAPDEILSIRGHSNNYTQAFIDLLSPYYLAF